MHGNHWWLHYTLYRLHACMLVALSLKKEGCDACTHTCFGAPCVYPLPLTQWMLEGDSGSVTCPEGSYCSYGGCLCYGGRVGPNCDVCKLKLHLVRRLHFTEQTWYLPHSMQHTVTSMWHAITMGAVATWMAQVCVCVGLHSLGMTAQNGFQVSGLKSLFLLVLLSCTCSVRQTCAYTNSRTECGHTFVIYVHLNSCLVSSFLHLYNLLTPVHLLVHSGSVCGSVTCVNGGRCQDGLCNCSYPFFGEDCSQHHACEWHVMSLVMCNIVSHIKPHEWHATSPMWVTWMALARVSILQFIYMPFFASLQVQESAWMMASA